MSESQAQPKAPGSVTPIGKPNGAAGKPIPPKSAGQRLDDLERAMVSLFQNMEKIAQDSNTVRDAVRLLGNKVDALAKANIRGESPTDETLSQIMIDNNVEELKGKVDGLIKAQVLVPTDIVGDTTFLVGRELAADSNKVTNPRLQFAINALGKEVGDKLKGRLVGDVIEVQEGIRFEVMEIYNIQQPPAPPAPEATPAAPTTEVVASSTASGESTEKEAAAAEAGAQAIAAQEPATPAQATTPSN